MPKCVQCGTSNPDDHRFCKECGAMLDTAKSGVVDDDTVIIQLLEGHGKSNTRPERTARLWLFDLTGGYIERVYELSDEQLIVGRRSDCTVCLPGNTVSRRHALIRHEDGRYLLSDLGSTNGTMLNGEAMVGEVELRHRDEIGVGIYKLTFRLD